MLLPLSHFFSTVAQDFYRLPVEIRTGFRRIQLAVYLQNYQTGTTDQKRVVTTSAPVQEVFFNHKYVTLVAQISSPK